MVSQQPLPNLIPVKDEATRPAEVVLLISEDMKGKAEALEKALKSCGCKVTKRSIHPYRIDEIREEIFALLSEREGKQVALNATGGTKIMALGAYEVFRGLDLPVFYVDSEHDQIVTLVPEQTTYALPELMTVKSYLAAYGYEVAGSAPHQVPPQHKQLTDFLVHDVRRLQEGIGSLNFYAQKAEKSLSVTIDRSTSPAFDEIVDAFTAAGLLGRDRNTLIFKDEEACAFSKGGWLEQHLLAIVNRLKGEGLVWDHLANVKIQNSNKVKNEIDMAFTARNRLHVIECKTKRMEDKPGKDPRVDDIAYKLDSLRDLAGGVYGNAMLVSYRTLTPEDRQRYRDDRISVIEAEQLIELPSRLRQWIVQ
jgi:hypothetical protein